MLEEQVYNEIKGNSVTLYFDGNDYEVYLNGMVVISTGDEFEAQLIAESLDVALSILDAQGLLKINQK